MIQQHQDPSPNRKPVANIMIHYPHIASINRKPFEAIADMPLLNDHPREPHASAVTLGTLLGPPLTSNRGRVMLPAGLITPVTRLLTECDFRVTVTPLDATEHYCEHHPPDDRDWRCPEFLRLAYGLRRALGLVPKTSGRLRLTADLVKQFPNENVLLLTKNLDQAQAVAKSLSAATGQRVTYGTEWWHGAPPFLHVDAVGTHNCRSCLDWRFLILWDAELLLSGRAMTQVLHTFSILLGFLTRDETSLNEMDRATIEAVLGEVIYRPADELSFTTVSVAWLAPPTYRADEPTNPLLRKRTFFWRNQHRNRLIAETARCFTTER